MSVSPYNALENPPLSPEVTRPSPVKSHFNRISITEPTAALLLALPLLTKRSPSLR
ncbi:MAG: hypothetical protein AMXMBFR20_20010 [Planctomycetia bacterium]